MYHIVNAFLFMPICRLYSDYMRLETGSLRGFRNQSWETDRDTQVSVDKITKPRCQEAEAAALMSITVRVVKDQAQTALQEDEQVSVEEDCWPK